MSPDPKAAILALAEDGPLVPLDGVAGAFIRRLSIAEVDEVGLTKEDSTIALIVKAVCDGEGKPLFTMQDAVQLKAIKARPFRDIAVQVARINRLSNEAGEELAKN